MDGLLCAGYYIRRLAQLGRHTRLLTIAGRATVGDGLVGVIRGMLGLTLPQYVVIHGAALTAIGLGVGGAAIVLGIWLLATLHTAQTLHRPNGCGGPPSPPPQRAALAAAAAVTVLGLFWTAGNLATRYGAEQAHARH